jgi:hypothetical protein
MASLVLCSIDGFEVGLRLYRFSPSGEILRHVRHLPLRTWKTTGYSPREEMMQVMVGDWQHPRHRTDW